MGQAIGQVLTFGVGIAISPLPVVAIVLILATPGGRSNGFAFLGGWVAGLVIVGTVVLLLATGADATSDGGPATWVSIVKIVLGVLLLLVAVCQWRSRPAEGAEAALPGWMSKMDTLTAGKAAGFAALLSGVNPKNLLLIVGAGAAIAQTGASTGGQAVALAVFVLLGSASVAAPVVIYLFMGDRAGQLLDSIRAWMARENATIMAVLCLVLAAKLIGDAVSALAS
jgi:threonine/homoserine/homoserine lactone efflux protein